MYDVQHCFIVEVVPHGLLRNYINHCVSVSKFAKKYCYLNYGLKLCGVVLFSSNKQYNLLEKLIKIKLKEKYIFLKINGCK